MSTNYEQAKSILIKQSLYNGGLYKEHLLEKASALATLALVDELRAAQEPAKTESESRYVFVLVRTISTGEKFNSSVYTSEDKVRAEVKDLNIRAVRQDVDVTWSYETLILNKGD